MLVAEARSVRLLKRSRNVNKKRLSQFSAAEFSTTNLNADELRAAEETVKTKKVMFSNDLIESESSLKDRKIALSTADGYFFADVHSISHCEADGSYTHFHFANARKLTVCKPLRRFDEELHMMGFFRIHKSYLVNLKEVEHYIKGEGGFVCLKNGIELPVSREMKIELLIRMGAK
jgi:two-component system LytT family response regulator